MRRDPKVVAKTIDATREAAGLPIGLEGSYCLLDEEVGVLDANGPPKDQPSLWCQWTPSKDGSAIQWDGGEKFYSYEEWIRYLIKHFLAPWHYKLNGKVSWQGEERPDKGFIYIDNNRVYINETPNVLDKIVEATSGGKRKKSRRG